MNEPIRSTDSADRIPRWTFGDRLRKVRQGYGDSQQVFALHLGVPGGTYASWEADNSKPRDVVAVARRLELMTRVPAAWILGLDEEVVPLAGFEPATHGLQHRQLWRTGEPPVWTVNALRIARTIGVVRTTTESTESADYLTPAGQRAAA